MKSKITRTFIFDPISGGYVKPDNYHSREIWLCAAITNTLFGVEGDRNNKNEPIDGDSITLTLSLNKPRTKYNWAKLKASSDGDFDYIQILDASCEEYSNRYVDPYSLLDSSVVDFLHEKGLSRKAFYVTCKVNKK